MSHEGGDNHFISARERDLGPLLDEARAQFELDQEKAELLDSLLENAWLAGTRSGHAKLLNEAIHQREEDSGGGDWEPPVEPVPMSDIETEFKAMMEAAADALNLPMDRTVALWDLLSRAWTTGVRTYESEVLASLIERRSDIVEELAKWMEENGGGS